MKKILSFMVTFLTINIIFVHSVLAAQLDVNVTSSVTDAKIGEILEMIISFNNLKDANKGINAYKGTLEYDKNVFEVVLQNDFTCLNNWEQLKYNLNNGQFVSIRKVGLLNNGEIAKIKFKVKSNINSTKTAIKIKDMVVSEGKHDIALNDVSLPINIIENQEDIPIKPVEPDKPNTDGNGSANKPNTGGSNINNSNSPGSSSDNKNDLDNNDDLDGSKDDKDDNIGTTTKPIDKDSDMNPDESDKISKTTSKYVWILVIIVAQIVIIFGLYLGYRFKFKNHNSIFSIVLLGIILTEFIGSTVVFAYSFAKKGEINGDSVIDYADVSLLEMHLVNLKAISSDKLENADMNSDGKITITDLSILVQKLEDILDYEVQLANIEPENAFPTKNQEVKVTFSGIVSYGAKIKKIIIDEKQYDTKEESDSSYSVTLKVGSDAGVKTYKITEVILDNEKSVKIDNQIDLEILKDIPNIINYRVEENKDDSKLIVYFDLIDEDRCTDSAFLEVFNDKQEAIITKNISRGPNRIELDVEEKKEYVAHIILNYNLSSNEEDTDHIGTQRYEKQLQLLIDYNFNISNIKILKDGKEVTTIENGSELKISFESTNSTKHLPTTIKIDGKEYEVIEENGKFLVALDPITTLGDKTFTIEEVVLTNGKKFELNENNTIDIHVNKRKPFVKDLTTTENTEIDNLKVMFHLDDEDKAVEELTIILYDANDKEIDRLRMFRDEIKEDNTVNKFLDTKLTTKYKVKVIYTYNVTGEDKDSVVDEVAVEQEVAADPRVTIKSITPNDYYLKKGGVVKLIYELESNKNEDITRIVVNNINCIAVKLDNGNYEVTLNVGNTSGLYTLNTTALTYSDGKITTVDETTKVEILKERPTVQNFVQIDNINSNEVTINFDLLDIENSFISGKAVMTIDGTAIEKEIKKGHNELTFQVEPSRKYRLDIKATYDLDNNLLSFKPEEDNRVEEDIIETREIELIADYQLSINNIRTYNDKGETRYFGKSEPIKICFDSNNITTFEPIKAIINGKEYDLIKENGSYHLTISSHRTSGVKTATIEKLVLNNSKEIIITENNEIRVTVLKDKPSIAEFGYKENVDGTITASFNVVDEEETITDGKVIIINNGNILKEQTLVRSKNSINFQPQENQNYTVKVVADYDLDMNVLEEDANEFKNITLLKADITLGARKFEMKDIIRTSIYKETSDGVVEVSRLSESDLSNLDNYIAKVYMKAMPTFYTTVSGYRIEDNKLKLTLNYDNVVQYSNNNKQDKLEIDFGEMVDGIAENITLEGLIKDIESNPTGTFTLTRDYDASIITTNSATLISGSFMGKINGNGYKIYNLTKPIFDTIESATIENLVLENPKVFGSTSRGTIANIAINSTIKNIHVKDLTMITGASKVAGIVGEATSTVFKQNSVVNFNITTSGHIRVAAIVGNMTGGSLKNCYAEGKIKSTQTKDGNGIAAIIGTSEGTEVIPVENCISKTFYESNVSPRLNGDIIGLALNNNAALKNNVSLSSGTNFYRIHGSTINSASVNNYELEESELTSNASGNRVKSISMDEINIDFFRNTAKFDEDVWNLTEVSYDNLPMLKFTEANVNGDDDDKPLNNKLYIPDYSRIKKINGYTDKKEILYHNLNKLMPYYDAKYLVEDGLKLSNEDILNEKIIKHIIPYSNDKMVTYLTSQSNNSITSIKVVFEDYTVQEYNVEFKELKQNIAIFNIDNLEVDYAYNNYVIKDNSNIVGIIRDYISNVDYTTTLDPLTQAADSRLYKDHFNETMKSIAEVIALQLLQNDSDSVLTIDNAILNNKIKQQLVDSGRLNRILYAYNYIHRWYNFEIGGSKVSEILLFEGKMYKDSLNIDNLTNEVLTGNLSTSVTNTFFVNNLRKYTDSSNIGLFLDNIIKNIGGYEDINDWFTEHFSNIGVLSEISLDSHPEIKYRAWDRIKGFQNFILPLSTLPKYAGYIISGPAQFQVGAQRVYVKDPDTAEGQKNFKNIVNEHSKLIKRQFETMAGSFHVESWNSFTIMVYDTCKTITGYKTSYIPGTNIPIGTTIVTTINRVGTTEPFHKNFNEAVGAWQYGSAAGVGNTAGFLWFIATPGLTNYDTWTHEYQHALHDKIIMFRRGTRLGLESYTQGNVEQRINWSLNNIQGYDVGPYYFNLAFTLNSDSLSTQNLTPERINTREKLENYYKGQLDALELLDYVSAKAFIKLTPEQQAKIATRMSQSGGWSSWGTITAEQAKNMNLTTLESLWDNRIMLRPNNAWGVSVRGLVPINGIGGNDYGYESIWVTRWYMGHNDSGSSDSFSNKKNLFEMLGYGGIDGYVIFGSKRSKTDLDAIQQITLAKTGTAMNWKQYRMSRYAEVESKKNNKYVNIDLMIEQFTNALINDANNGNRNITNATNLRKVYYHYLKRVTNDFIDDPLGTTLEMEHIKTAEELVEKMNKQPYGYYVLDNDIDFSHMTTNVTSLFMGKLDGNGHKITGNTLPIFQRIKYAYIKNLVIEGTNIPMNIANVGALSSRTDYSVLEDVRAHNIQLNFGGRNDLSLIAGAGSTIVNSGLEVETLKIKINSFDDLTKINQNPGGIYVLETDLDFTGYTGSGSVITVPFTGKLNGNGHTLSNLNNLSLFGTLNGTVENLNIRSFSNIAPNSDDVSVFAKLTNGATIRNIKFENISIEGRHRAAVVASFDNANSKFENISVKNANVKGSGVYVSTFIGRKYGGSIKNVYVEGNIEITTTENGGIVGAFQKGGTMENVVSRVNIHKTRNTYTSNIAESERNGGLIGNIYDKPVIKNSIALGNMKGFMNGDVEKIPYKAFASTETIINSTVENCFEYAGAHGFSSITEATSNKLKVATETQIRTKTFWKDTLFFDESIWNLDISTEKGYPELK